MKYSQKIPEWKEKYESGASYRQIAKESGISAGTVRRTLRGHVVQREKVDYSKYAEEWKQLVLEEGWNRNEISKHYNANHTIVTQTLSRAGVVLTERKFEHLSKEMATLYEGGKSLTEISEELGVSRQTILNHLTDSKIEIRETSERNRTFKINERYFDIIQSNENAYQLGIVFAIGTYPGAFQTYALSLAEKKNKQYLIEEILSALYPEDHVAITIDKQDIAKVRIFSKHLQETLNLYGLSKKQETRFPENLDEKLVPAFIAGYYSGRGYIERDKNNVHMSGSAVFISSVVQKFTKAYPSARLTVRETSENMARISIYNNKTVEYFFNWLELNNPELQSGNAMKKVSVRA